MKNQKIILGSIIALTVLSILACGETAIPTREATVVPTAAPMEEATGPAEAEPTDTPEPTDMPIPTDTPAPVYTDPVILAEIEGVGESVTDNFEWPSCQKAVFYWTAFPSSYGNASLIVDLHNVEMGRDMPLINEFAMDVSGDGISGAALQPLAGGEYYFSTENTDEAWALRVECQDGAAPVTWGLDLRSTGNMVSDNYELPTCNKSVFVWSAEPSESGTASLAIYLCKVGEDRCPILVNEFGMDLKEPFKGEALEVLSGGIYFLAIDNASGTPWSIHWECQD